MNIKFMSAEHKAFFEEKVQKYHIEDDRYRLAAIYVLGLSADCRKNFPIAMTVIVVTMKH